MDKRPPSLPISLFRGGRLALHLFYAALLAIFYPHLKQATRRRILKTWSRQLLSILGIGIRTEGQWPVRGEGGYLVVANHVSWLDIFVLNTIYPSRFIARAEVRDWPLIGWLCKRGNTIFIERSMRQDAASANRHVSTLLKQGVCIGLFPEGTTTDGKRAGHFHSAHIQPAIDAGAMLCPIALRYQDGNGKQSAAAAFTGDITLAQSIWRILRSPRFDALLTFTPALPATGENRRALARAAQEAISQELLNISAMRCAPEPETPSAVAETLLSAQSAYVPPLRPLPVQTPK
ncbi:lysophospholipid acyltransferase family protein [Candidatus Ferrigenium straubiae]|jgi:1-acyl-sn-glycerol-3-phosphate acyltransferase|uniref:lysophospholipid acyltransferase family protein n=1 Tax=Candidatus Ferrigenium straubiae TaxID=2919506 RepID=UPI003F4AA94B